MSFDPEILEYFKSAWKPSTIETSYEITDVRGEIPEAISGTLYRNGPSQKIMPEQGYEALHLFDGDGLVHGFRIHEGRVHYTSQFVKNQSFLVEQEAGKVNQHLFNIECENSTTEVMMRQQPNTNVVHHAGRVFALVENARPFELDPRTLDAIGEYDLDGRMVSMATSAHPKIDGRTGEMIIHGYQPFPPFLSMYAIDADGKVTMAEAMDIPSPTMLHDLAITENYIIIPVPPMTFSPPRIGPMGPEGAPSEWLQVKPELGLRFAVRRREPGSPIKWFDAPHAGFIFHPGNAYEQDGKLIMDACTYLQPQKLLDLIAGFRSADLVDNIGGHPFLYELDLEAGTCKATQLSDRAAEFPRLDERRVGYYNRYGYALVADDVIAGPQENSVAKYDREGGTLQTHTFGRGCFPGEAVFVPRSPDAEEDDGFVLTVVYDGPEDTSYLAILDARNLQAEPIATARVRDRVPMGFHGNFAPGVV